jgi:hypothetical protein
VGRGDIRGEYSVPDGGTTGERITVDRARLLEPIAYVLRAFGALNRPGVGQGSKSTGPPGRLHDQMYSSAIAPLLHRATVTMRPPASNSPTTHVHPPDPNLIGCEVI